MSLQFHLDPFQESHVFIFCNKKKDAIKVLRYDRNGFVLAAKKRLDGMKFQWPRTPEEAVELTREQYRFLMNGLNPVNPKIREIQPSKVL